MLKSNVIGLLVMITALSLIPIAVVGQTQRSQNMREKLFDFEFRKSDFHSALGSLAKKYKIAIGLRATESPEAATCAEVFDLSFKNKTIDYVLNSLVSKCPNYKWSFVDEVINVEPATAEPFLTEIQISSLKIQQLNISQIVDAIFETNELQLALRSEGLVREDSKPIGIVSRPLKYNLDFKNNTVRQILNCLIGTTENRMWVFQRFQTDKMRVSLDVF